MSLNKSELSSSEHLKASKVTPYKSAGISKSFLTPCRRLGLSRKFKDNNIQGSPNTPIRSTPPSASTTPSGEIKIKETPIVTPLKEENEKIRKQTGSRVKIQSRFKEESVEGCLKGYSPVFDNKDNQEVVNTSISSPVSSPTTLLDVKKIKETPILRTSPIQGGGEKRKRNIVTTNTKESIQSKEESVKGDSPINDSKAKQSDSNKTKKLKRTKVEEKENKSKSSEVVKLNKENEKKVSKPCLETKDDSENLAPKSSKVDSMNPASSTKKTYKRSLSLKKSSSSIENELPVNLLTTPKTSSSSLLANEFLKECSVKVENIMGVIKENEEEIEDVPRKRRCIIYSSDEDDFVPSQNSIKKEQDEDWFAKIVELKREIKKKESRLGDLKQAGVYRRLHDVKELGESVQLWKKCCEASLMDLLPMLQEHGQMDMCTLMKNLNIPHNIVYDPNTDSFI